MSVFRKLFTYSLRMLFVLLAAIVAWDVFVIVASNQTPPWLWIIRRPHYEVTFSIRFPDGIRTARGVVEAVYYADPWWDNTIPSLGSDMPVVGRVLNGEAVTMCLPNGKAVSMVLNPQFETIPRGSDDLSRFHVSNELILILADQLLTQQHPDAFLRFREWGKDRSYITAFSADSLAGSYDIPGDLVPSMIFFDNAADVHSAHLFEPDKPDVWLGSGAKFLGATLAVTDAPVQSDSRKCLTWLSGCNYYPTGIPIPPEPAPGKDDPIARESKEYKVGLGWCAYFYYRNAR